MRNIALFIISVFIFSGCVSTKSFELFKTVNSAELDRMQANQEMLKEQKRKLESALKEVNISLGVIVNNVTETRQRTIANLIDLYKLNSSLRGNLEDQALKVAFLEMGQTGIAKKLGELEKKLDRLMKKLNKLNKEYEGLNILLPAYAYFTKLVIWEIPHIKNEMDRLDGMIKEHLQEQKK